MSNIDENNIQRMIGRLESEDSRNTFRFKALRILFMIFVPLYLIMGTVGFLRGLELTQALAYVAYVISFCFCFILMQKHVEMYDQVDYSQPTLIMLKQAKMRYRIFPSRPWGLMYIAGAFFFIGLGYCLNSWGDMEELCIMFGIFICAIIVGLMLGCAFWYIRDKPIYDILTKLINDLESKN